MSRRIPLECYVCEGPYEHSDHVIPAVLEGSNEPENLLPMCAYCNVSKNGTPLLKWLRDKHPEKVEDVMTRLRNDYKVLPYTKQDIVWVA